MHFMLSLTLFIFSAFALQVVSESNFENHKVLGVSVTSLKQLEVLKDLQDTYKLDFWNEITLQGVTYIQVPPESLQDVEITLENNDFNFFIQHENVQRVIDEFMSKNVHEGRIQDADPINFNLTSYHNLDEIYQFLQDLADTDPSSISVTDIGTTFENRTLKILKFGVGDKPVIFIEAGIHAREWIAPAVALYFIYQLAYQYGVDSEVTALRDNYDWHFLVSTNPDGYDFTWTDNRLWRKNRTPYGELAVCYGVDLNRNFDNNFGSNTRIPSEGSSDVTCSETYHGPSAFSELETQAVRDYVTPIRSEVALYLSLHSYSQYWLIPYAYTADPSADNERLMSLSQIGVDTLFSVYGTRYSNGPWYSVMYESGGTSLDWGYDNLAIKTIFTVELRDTGVYGFLLPEDQIDATSFETWQAVKAVIAAL